MLPSHFPVLLKEVLQYINASTGKRFIDGTVGGGGHLSAIVSVSKDNEGLGIDLDQTSLDKLKEKFTQEGLNQRIKLVQGSYKNVDQIVSSVGWDKVDGILLDLGFSSLQLDDPERGFSFSNEGPLDMRYDRSSDFTAERVVNTYHPKDLEHVIEDYGEEKLARRVVSKIVEARKKGTIKATTQLAQLIKSAVPLHIRFKAQDSIRRVFQAIRIEVNSELENLKIALPKMLKLLNPHGRLVVISFHSLEDRIVKEFFARESKDCICPPEFPICICGKSSQIRILTRKPVVASEGEIVNNPRSKPAKLRAVEKIN